jgi:hypothetical protein
MTSLRFFNEYIEDYKINFYVIFICSHLLNIIYTKIQEKGPMLILRYKKKRSLCQYQIDDYFGCGNKIIFDMSKPSDYRKGRKAFTLHKKPKKRGAPRKGKFRKKTYILDYIMINQGNIMKREYLFRFPTYLRSPTQEGRNYLSSIDALLYWEVKGFQGFFDDLFLLADLKHWDRLEVNLASKNLMREIPCLHDMFIYECIRIHLGIETYAQFWRIISFFNPSAILPLLKQPNFIPCDQDFSDFYHIIPLDAFEEFLWSLIQETFDRKMVSCRILIWDCQFLHSNSSDYKNRQTGHYTDRDAGLGRHNNKFLGVGYMISTLYAYCNDIIVPVFCMLFPANLNDKTIFHETMAYYFKRKLPRPLVVLADAGPYSLKNLRYLAKNGVVGMMNAPKNVKKHNIITLTNNIRLNRDFIPSQWSDDDCRLIYNIRSEIERQFSHNTLVYHARRMNVRGIDQAAKHRYMILNVDLLKALVCHKLGRGDLFQISTAFSQMRNGYTEQVVQRQFSHQGFDLLLPDIPKEGRHKE